MQRVGNDQRTHGDHLLGVHRRRIFGEVIGGGQADFDANWVDQNGHTLTGFDRALLYAYFNQKGHIEELSTAMAMLFRQATVLENPLVLDLGCGPCTAGLALADAMGPGATFDYIGLDRAQSMHSLGEQLASASQASSHMTAVRRTWVRSLGEYSPQGAPGWRTILVIVSYLLASPTLDPVALLDEAMALVDRIGCGPVVVLYTNSTSTDANRSFPAFRGALTRHGFDIICDDRGTIPTESRSRELQYALFRRQPRDVLSLGGE